MHYEVLPNGIKLLLKKNPSSQITAIQCWVHTGSVNEEIDERGAAHFVEHMLFKGAGSGCSEELGSVIESFGGEINAYTTFDWTVYHLTVPKDYSTEALQLLVEMLVDNQFEDSDFRSEKSVILEEIKKDRDSPTNVLAQKVFSIMYESIEAGRPIAGTLDSVTSLTRQRVYDFYRRWYQPSNMHLVIVSPQGLEDLREVAIQSFVNTKVGNTTAVESKLKPQGPIKACPRVEILKGSYQLPRLVMAFRAPPLGHLDSLALSLAAFLLGGGESSRLSRRVRDEKGLASGIMASLYSPDIGGIFDINVSLNVEDTHKVIAEVFSVIQEFCNQAPPTEGELSKARKCLRADRIYRAEQAEGMAKSFGYSLSTKFGYRAEDAFSAIITSFSVEEITLAVKRWLVPSNLAIVCQIPEGSSLDKSMIESAIPGSNSLTSVVPNFSVAKSASSVQEVEKVQLMDGVKLIYRRDLGSELCSFSMVGRGGSISEDQSTSGSFNAIASMVGRSTRQIPFRRFAEIEEGAAASISGFSGKDSFGLSLSCLAEDAFEMAELLVQSFINPGFEVELWAQVQREILDGIKHLRDSPSNVCMKLLQEQLFPDHPYGLPLMGSDEIVSRFDPQCLLDLYQKSIRETEWVICVSSKEEYGKVKEFLEGQLVTFNSRASRVTGALMNPLKAHIHKNVEMKRQQAHLALGFQGLSWFDPDREALDVLVHVLGGQGGRLFSNLRVEKGLVYNVSPLLTYGCFGGGVGAYLACSPEHLEEAWDSLDSEIEAICETPCALSELERAKNFLIGQHEAEMQQSDAKVMTMALMELYGVGFDDFTRHANRIRGVGALAVQEVARRLFSDKPKVKVQVGG